MTLGFLLGVNVHCLPIPRQSVESTMRWLFEGFGSPLYDDKQNVVPFSWNAPFDNLVH